MKELIGIFGVPVLTYGSWWFSLRRTPYASQWLGLATIYALGVGIGAAAIVVDPHSHVTLVGTLGIVFGFGFPVLVAAWVTELTALDQGAVRAFRRSGSPRRKARRSGKWRVLTNAPESSGRVPVVVTNGRAERKIGALDPLEDMDKFMDLKTQAQQAAETFNALKVGSP